MSCRRDNGNSRSQEEREQLQSFQADVESKRGISFLELVDERLDRFPENAQRAVLLLGDAPQRARTPQVAIPWARALEKRQLLADGRAHEDRFHSRLLSPPLGEQWPIRSRPL